MLLNSLLTALRRARLPRRTLLTTAGILLAGVSISASAAETTVSFSSTEPSAWNDGIAEDGDGGSVNISGKVVQFYPISDTSGTHLNLPLVHGDSYQSDEFMALTTYHSSVQGAGFKGMGISSQDGSVFQINGFFYSNYGEGGAITITVKGYYGGDEVAFTSFSTASAGWWQSKTVTLDSTFDHVDEVRLYSSGTSWHGINAIKIDDAVAVNNAPTDIQLSNVSVNQSVGVNAVVGTLSTTDADGDPSFTYTLVAGTGDTDNASFNISESSLRANDSGALAAGNYSVRVQTDDGNGGTYAEAFSITVADDVAPTVVSVAAPTNGTYRASVFLDFTVSFTDPVTVLGVPALELTVGETARTATFHSGGGTTDLVFRHTVEVDDEDMDGVAVGALTAAGGTIRDAAANNAVLTLNNVASTAGVLVDGVAPLVSSVTRKTPLAQMTDATTVVFEVTFSEDMINVDAAGFAVTPVNDGTVTANVTGVSGGPRIYDVTVLITGGLGEFRLDVNGQ